MGYWSEQFAFWQDPSQWDDTVPATDDRAIGQLVYSAIYDFLDERCAELYDALATDEDGRVIDKLVDDWVTAKADAGLVRVGDGD